MYGREIKETKEQIELEVSALKQSLQSTKAHTEQEVKKLEEARELSQIKVAELEYALK